MAAYGAPTAQVWQRAADTVRAAAEAIRAGSDPVVTAAVLSAAADLLTAAARRWEGRSGGPLTDAAEQLDHAAYDPGVRMRVQARPVGHLRRLARLIAAMGALPADRNTAIVLDLLHALAGLTDTVIALRQAQDRLHQVRAAQLAAEYLRAWTPPTQPPPDAAAGPAERRSMAADPLTRRAGRAR
jgi:sugar phosphate isomerase/epimerase